jgi:Ni/Fe-hydrogenase subunit HybB-like protein
MISALVNAGALFLMPKLAVPALVIHGIVLVISPLLGIWLIQACVSFRAVARTDVADKAYLLRGFERLHHYFMTIGILLIVGIVAAVVLLVLRLVRGGLSFH